MSIITTHSLAAVPSAHRNVFFVLAKIRRALNACVAAHLAFHERRSTAWALRRMSERELKDIGVYRGQSLGHPGERIKQRAMTP